MADFPFSTQFSLLYFNVSELSFVRMTINEIPGQFGWFTNRGEVQQNVLRKRQLERPNINWTRQFR